MIKALLNYFRPTSTPVFLDRYTEPKYTTIGTMDGCLYFINNRSGKMYRLSRNYNAEYEQLCHVVTLTDR